MDTLPTTYWCQAWGMVRINGGICQQKIFMIFYPSGTFKWRSTIHEWYEWNMSTYQNNSQQFSSLGGAQSLMNRRIGGGVPDCKFDAFFWHFTWKLLFPRGIKSLDLLTNASISYCSLEKQRNTHCLMIWECFPKCDMNYDFCHGFNPRQVHP